MMADAISPYIGAAGPGQMTARSAPARRGAIRYSLVGRRRQSPLDEDAANAILNLLALNDSLHGRIVTAA